MLVNNTYQKFLQLRSEIGENLFWYETEKEFVQPTGEKYPDGRVEVCTIIDKKLYAVKNPTLLLTPETFADKYMNQNVDSSEFSQSSIRSSSKLSHDFNSDLSDDCQGVIKFSSECNQNIVKAFKKAVEGLTADKNTDLQCKTEILLNQLQNHLQTGNSKDAEKNIKELTGIISKAVGMKKGRNYLPEPQPINLSEHKQVCKLLQSNSFIRKATSNRYTSFEKLPANCPNELAEYISNNLRLRYSVYQISEIIGAMRRENYKKKESFKKLAFILIIPILSFYIGTKINGKSSSIITETSAITSNFSINSDSLIEEYISAKKIKIWQWRREKLKSLIHQNQITEIEKIDSLNSIIR